MSAICSFSDYSASLTEDIRSSPFAIEILLLILLHTHVIASSHGSGHLLDPRIITEVYGSVKNTCCYKFSELSQLLDVWNFTVFGSVCLNSQRHWCCMYREYMVQWQSAWSPAGKHVFKSVLWVCFIFHGQTQPFWKSVCKYNLYLWDVCIGELQPLVSLAVWERRHERLLGFGALKVLYETDLIS